LDAPRPDSESNVHPALRSVLNSRIEGIGHANRRDRLDSDSSVTHLINQNTADVMPTSPPITYSPTDYRPRTPSPRTGYFEVVSLPSKPMRPLPTPVQPKRLLANQSPRADVSPLGSSASLPTRSQLPMSFLGEINAKREEQAGQRQAVSPTQNPISPVYERSRSESQLSPRNVSPVSGLSITPVTSPGATPSYMPHPFSKYNPYRPALEPAGSKCWPVETMAIPENATVDTSPSTAGPTLSPIRKHLSQSQLKAGDSIFRDNPPPTPERRSNSKPVSIVTVVNENSTPIAKPPHQELDPIYLAEFHRRRRRQQKAREEAQKQRRMERLRKSPTSPSPKQGKRRTNPGNAKAMHSMVPPRIPSRSRKPSQSPDAYEKARRISGLHELVGSALVIREV
jgi:hypothetical protein